MNKEKIISALRRSVWWERFLQHTKIFFWCACFKPNIFTLKIKEVFLSDLINTILEVPCYLTVRFVMFYCLFILSIDFSNITFYYYLLLSPAKPSDTPQWWLKQFFKTLLSLTNIFHVCFITHGPISSFICWCHVDMWLIFIRFSKNLLVPSSVALLLKSNFLKGIWILFYFI